MRDFLDERRKIIFNKSFVKLLLKKGIYLFIQIIKLYFTIQQLYDVEVSKTSCRKK
jgi:hypothetical protein